jgi:hypothetical protein
MRPSTFESNLQACRVAFNATRDPQSNNHVHSAESEQRPAGTGGRLFELEPLLLEPSPS